MCLNVSQFVCYSTFLFENSDRRAGCFPRRVYFDSYSYRARSIIKWSERMGVLPGGSVVAAQSDTLIPPIKSYK